MSWDKTRHLALGFDWPPWTAPDFMNTELAPDSTFHWSQKTDSPLGSQKAEKLNSPQPWSWSYLVHFLHHPSCAVSIYREDNGTFACELMGSWGLAWVLQAWEQFVQHMKQQPVLALGVLLASHWHLLGKEWKKIIFREVLRPSHISWLLKEANLFGNSPGPCTLCISN